MSASTFHDHFHFCGSVLPLTPIAFFIFLMENSGGSPLSPSEKEVLKYRKPVGPGELPSSLPKVLKMSVGTGRLQGMVLRYVGLFD